MHNDFIEEVYDTLCGYLVPERCVPGVENAFAPGSKCDQCYEAATEARERILQRLGVEEDPDMEHIFDALTQIVREIGVKMFVYGIRFGGEVPQQETSFMRDNLKQS